ncbi:MAG: NADP-dependent isocitrate dehydrogenase [Cellulomonadaceae bacterium]|jgi:isocitrate dehydrogenase|nr:NADP-dependent isocitrate dehydrogenase [Cellulomonadaceae bacterium]
MSERPAILYTLTDEAPLQATYSFLPIIQAFAKAADVPVETRDISLSGRILAQFPDITGAPDALAELGALTADPTANIIKLPNISASMPQLRAAIAELQAQGVALPDYPENPDTLDERHIGVAYDRAKGSAVNPVLRQGNSDRRAPASVKAYAKAHPQRMGTWSPDSRTRVATMSAGDFRDNEQSVIMPKEDWLTIRLTPTDGSGHIILKHGMAVQPGDIVDGTFMSVAALRAFLVEQVAAAKEEGVLFSAHLKATMMKVSDPIIFGHVIEAFAPEVFTEYRDQLAAAGVNAREGIAQCAAKAQVLPEAAAIFAAVTRSFANGPDLAMVDSDKGITNLHVPSDVIIDASMPAMIRAGGKMWGPDGKEHDTLAVIPDSSYAGVYQAVILDCIDHGALDPATMGTVPNVGLMAQAAEEYGSHDKTFEIPADGLVEILDSDGDVVMAHEVQAGDIWRACQTTDAAVRDWVHLAVDRAQISGMPAVFWLDEFRAHDANIMSLVHRYLTEYGPGDANIQIMAPEDACTATLERARAGKDTISVTGNVLRDYLTDLFPILELGTSAKMLSVVPLMSGGGLFETGAGGSAPKHAQQLLAEDYLRWDSLGEFFALAASLDHYARVNDCAPAAVLADTVDRATGTFLENDKSPTRHIGGIDNRGSHFYLALYWAQELAAQKEDAALAHTFAPVAEALAAHEDTIVAELIAAQGHAVDIGGYYRPDPALVAQVMRPSPTFNAIVDGLAAA